MKSLIGKVAKIWAAVTGLILVVVLNSLGFDRPLDTNFEQPVLFQIRDLLDKNPPISPKIKVFGFDDSTVAAVKKMDLPLSWWALMFQSLAKQKPKAILIDKIFDRQYPKADVEKFRKIMAAVDVPLTTVGFISDKKIPLRKVLGDHHQTHRIETFGLTPQSKNPQVVPEFFYGANEMLAPSVDRIGHAVYPGDGSIKAFYRTDAETMVPHWCFTVAEQLGLTAAGFFVDGFPVPLDSQNNLQLNISPREKYSERTYSLLPVLARMNKKKPISVVNEGDYVVILPAYYTGNTDFKRTPMGVMPGGFAMVSLLNSVVTQQWITPFKWPFVLSLLAWLLACLVGYSFTPKPFLVVFSSTSLGFVLTVVVAFVYFNCIVSWVLPLLSFNLSAILCFGQKTYLQNLQRALFEKELEMTSVVQESMLPEKVSDDNIASIYQPASRCSGDWFAIMRSKDNRLCLVIADATGHGAPAALVTAMCHTSVHNSFKLLDEIDSLSAANLLWEINNKLCYPRENIATLTMTVALIDEERGVVEFSSAGHPPSYHLRQNKVKMINSPGNILGMFTDEPFSNKQVSLEPGDTLVLYSDGLIENKDKDGKLISRPSLRKILRNKANNGSVQSLGESFTEQLQRHNQDVKFIEDDVTMIFYRYEPASLPAASLEQAS